MSGKVRIFDSSIDPDIVHFVENLDDHLDRIRVAFPQNARILDGHFANETIATLAPLVVEKMRKTQSNGQEHSFAYPHNSVWYQVCTLPVGLDRAIDWFFRMYGGYSKLLERTWNSTDFQCANCAFFYHIIYGWTEKGGTWIHMAMIPIKRPSSIMIVLPVEFLTEEEQRIISVWASSRHGIAARLWGWLREHTCNILNINH